MPKHEWNCDKCGRTEMFRQPERFDDDDPRSEVNKDKTCVCGEEMYFDEVPEIDVTTLVVPSQEDIDNTDL